MTDITERIARAIYPEAWEMEPSHEAEYAKARTVLDANTAVAVMERAGISKETIGKLISGEYVAVPSDALDVLATVTEDTLEMDGAQWREQDSIRVANAVTAVREAMLDKEQS